MAVGVAQRHHQHVLGVPHRRVVDLRDIRDVGVRGHRRPVERAVADHVGAALLEALVEDRVPDVPAADVADQRLQSGLAAVDRLDPEVVPLRAVQVDDDDAVAQRVGGRPGDRREQRVDLGAAAHQPGDLEQAAEAAGGGTLVARARHAAKCSCSPHRFALYMARSAARKIRLGIVAVAGEHGDAEARSQPLEERLLGAVEAARDALDHRPHVRLVGLRQQQRELVAADPERQVGAADGAVQQAAEQRQSGIARLVAVPVVQLLEAVQVAQHQRERPVVAARAGGLVAEPAGERAAVEQARQRVVLGEVAHLLEVVRRVDRGRRLVGEHAQRLQHVPAGDQPVLAGRPPRSRPTARRPCRSAAPAASDGSTPAGRPRCARTRAPGGRTPAAGGRSPRSSR